MRAKFVNEGEIRDLFKPKSKDEIIKNINSFSQRKKDSYLLINVWKGNFTQTEILLKNGANPNCKTNSGETPIYYASLYQKNDLYNLLKKYGAE